MNFSKRLASSVTCEGVCFENFLTGSITKYKIMSDGKSILWRSLKNEWEVNGLKYHFQFLEQY